MKTKRIKNDTGGDKTYLGQTISAGAYYQVQPSEEFLWMNDKALVSDISIGDALVNDGSSDFSDWMEGLNYLKDLEVLRTQPAISQDNQTREPFGVYFEGTATSTTTHDFALPYTCSLRGGKINVVDCVPGDNFDVQIVDVDGIVYPADTVLKTYVRTYNPFEGIPQEEIDESISEPINSVFYIRVIYRSHSSATLNPKVSINFVGYE